jgi:hypothetical protein
MRGAVGKGRWQYLHRKVKRKVYLYLVIFILMTAISAYDVLAGYIPILIALAGWCMGTLIGYLSGRATKLHWEQDAGQVVSRRDAKGIIVLVLYIIFVLVRKQLFEAWLHGTTLTAFCFCVIAGVRFGRIFRLRRKIGQVLKREGII